MSSSEFTFSHTFESVSQMCNSDSTQFSQTHFFKDMPWYLNAKVVDSEQRIRIGIYINCNDDDESGLWRCSHFTKLTLINQDDKEKNVVHEIKEDFDSNSDNYGFMFFLEEMLQEDGYIKEDQLIIEAHVVVLEVVGIRETLKFDFSVPGPGTDNVCFILEDGRVHVGKQYLALHSPVFSAMFYQNFDEKEKAEIKLPGVETEEFTELLNVIYPSYKPVTYDSHRYILELADRFQIKKATEAAEDYLIKNGNWRFQYLDKLVIADQFRLSRLTVDCLKSFKTAYQIKKIKHRDEFKKFSDRMKAQICNRLMELIPDENGDIKQEVRSTSGTPSH